MRDREMQLIADLVEGRLDDDAAARALIYSSPELTAEYEAQRLAFQSLSSAGPAVMSDAERAALRRDVWTTFRSATATASSGHWSYRWASAAAGVLVLVGLVGVLSRGQNADTLEEANRLMADTTSAAATSGEDAGGEVPYEGDGGSLSPAAPTDENALAAFFSEEAERVRGSAQLGYGAGSFDHPSDDKSVESCVAASGLQDYVAVGVVWSETRDRSADSIPQGVEGFIAAVPEGAELATAPVAFVENRTCEVLHLEE